MTLHRTLPAVLVLFGLMSAPLLAHHSIAVGFDGTNAATMQGVITKVEWRNPHIGITLESKDANGLVTSWRVEGRSPTTLFINGIRREDFELAKPCFMEIWPARDGSKTATGRKLTFADGKSFDISDKFGDALLDVRGK
jgi:hypothetical protein